MSKSTNYLILICISLLLFMPGIAKLPVIDRDEAHFAQASRQMIQTGQYFQIRFQDNTRFQKPPGINWLQAASVKLFGQTSVSAIWAYRIPSLLAALFSVLLTYYFTRRFLNSATARLAALFLGSSLLLVVESHMAVIDSALLFATVLMQGSLWVIFQQGMDSKKAHWGWAFCFWLAMAFGFVLKGVTPLVGFLSILSLSLVEKRRNWLRELHLLPGILLFLILTFSWLYKVNAAEESNYLLQMFHKDLLPKLKGGHESHGKPPLFHLAILPLTFWPASLFLWQAAVYAFRQRSQPLVKFLLAWILPTWIFFELMPTKLPQYILPTFPALAMLCALALQSCEAKTPSKGLKFLQILWGILSLGIAIAFISLGYLVFEHLSIIGIVLFLVIASLSLLALRFATSGLYKKASVSILAMAVLSYSLIFSAFLPNLKPIWLSNNISKLINKKEISPQKPLLVVGFQEPSLVFNLDTQLVQFVNSIIAEISLTADPTRIAIVEAPVFKEWLSRHSNFYSIGQARGFNYSKGRWLELFIVKQIGADRVAV